MGIKYFVGIYFLVFAVFSCAWAQSGETGLPFIQNFTPKEYNANTQNWAVVQDQRGVMYFGNNKGVLEYDGVSWRLIPVKNHSVVRSLAIDSAGTIFVGAVGEFGYLAPDSTGKLQYQSLLNAEGASDLLFADVWSTLVKGDEVYFHTKNLLFRYKGGQINSWKLQDSYHRSFLVNNKLYLREAGKGLMVLEGDSLVKVGGGSLFEKEVISTMLPLGEKLLIGTRSRGLFIYDPAVETIYPFQAEANKVLKESLIYHGLRLANGNYAFATIKSGIVVVDEAGNNLLHLRESTGLQQNLVLYLYSDIHGTLWAGLAKGISKIEINLPIRTYDGVLGIRGGVNAVIRHKGTLFVATHQGVYFLNKQNHFEKIKGFDAQCFYFEKFTPPSPEGEQKLLLASSLGVYEVERDKVSPLMEGGAYFLHASGADSSRVFIGFTESVGALRYKNNRWEEEGRLEMDNHAIRSIEEDSLGNLWLSSMFAGVYRLKLSDWEAYVSGKKESVQGAVESYGTAEGLPSLNWNMFFRVSHKLVVASQKGVYAYNPLSNTFEKDSSLNKPFKEQERWIYVLSEDEQGNVWFDSEKGKGVLVKEENGYVLAGKQLKRISVSQENIVGVLNEENGVIWFGTPDGLFQYDSRRLNFKEENFQALIRKVVLGEDSLVFSGNHPRALAADKQKKAGPGDRNQTASVRLQLPYAENSISFHFAVPAFHLEGSNSFSYFLEGYDKQWSGWNQGTKKEYTNLPEGHYTFRVKAKNLYEDESLPASFGFTVLPPWYRTMEAYAAYMLAFILAFAGVSRLYAHKLKKDNERLELIVKNRTAEIAEQKSQVEKSYQHLTTLSQVGQNITASLDFKSIIQTLYKSINMLMDATSFGVGIFNAKAKNIEFQGLYENGEELPPFSNSLTDETRLSVWCFKNQKEVLINDREKEYKKYLPYLGAPSGGIHSESVIYLPMKLKEKTIGVITVQSFEKGAYQPYHLDILRTLAAYTAIALDNSYAYLRVSEINRELSTTLENLKHTQIQLVQSEKMASLGQLTAGVAHEINNPINFVSAGIDSLTVNYQELQELLVKLSCLKAGQDNTALLEEIEALKKQTELDYLLQEIPQLLQSIKTGAQRTTEIVKSLKNFTRLDEDSLKMANLQEGLDSTLVILRNQLSEHIQVVKEYDEQLPLVHCYPGQLNQVFMNILNNAIQALEGEGEIRISTARKAEQVLIRIKDSGRGMSAEVKSRIFEPFFTTKEVGEGTGLGLSISYSIIEKHKGKIEVESTPGKGTEIIIRLPLILN